MSIAHRPAAADLRRRKRERLRDIFEMPDTYDDRVRVGGVAEHSSVMSMVLLSSYIRK
jgi:hypothetical protein